MRYYLFTYTYDVKSENKDILFVVEALDTHNAINKISGCFHEGYANRKISSIDKDEAILFREKRMDVGVWRVTRDNTPIVIELEKRINFATGFVNHSFNVMSSM